MEDREHLIVSTATKPLGEYGAVKAEEDNHKRSKGISNTLKLLFFICGLSTFARSEAVLMQTQMYAKCFHLGPNFYAAASSAIFMPGIFIQMIQTKYDRVFDRKYGTYKAAAFRIVLSYAASLIALLALILAAKDDASLRDSPMFVYLLLAIMGLGISVSFGCFVQISSMFPPELHAFFFFGNYAPFFIFAPVNVGIGDLCEKVKIDDKTGGDPTYSWETRWDSVTVYYIVAVTITLAGLICFFGIAKHPKGKQLFAKKDAELRQGSNQGTPGVNSETTVLYELGSHGAQALIEQDMSTLTCFRSVWIEIVAQSITTVCSTLIAALYIDIPASHFEDLSTILLYDYYIFGSAGIVLTSFRPVRKLITSKTLLIMSIFRVAFVPLTIMCTQGLVCHVELLLYIPYHFIVLLQFGRNDYIVVALNSFQMAIGGMVFSLSFSYAADKFHTKPARTLASTIMNVFYYIAMAVAMGSSFALKHNESS